jgi:hypothetical protein
MFLARGLWIKDLILDTNTFRHGASVLATMLFVWVSASRAPLTSDRAVLDTARAQRELSLATLTVSCRPSTSWPLSESIALVDMACSSRSVEPPGLTPRVARSGADALGINKNRASCGCPARRHGGGAGAVRIQAHAVL